MSNFPLLLTIEELAQYLKVSRNTIYYWVSRNEIPTLRIGKHLRFDRNRVLAHFESQEISSGPQSWSLKTNRDLADSSKKGIGNGNR